MVGESLEGQPPIGLKRAKHSLEQSLNMAEGLTSVFLAMASPEVDPKIEYGRLIDLINKDTDVHGDGIVLFLL